SARQVLSSGTIYRLPVLHESPPAIDRSPCVAALAYLSMSGSDVSIGSVTDGHDDEATPDVRAPLRSWPLAFQRQKCVAHSEWRRLSSAKPHSPYGSRRREAGAHISEAVLALASGFHSRRHLLIASIPRGSSPSRGSQKRYLRTARTWEAWFR